MIDYSSVSYSIYIKIINYIDVETSSIKCPVNRKVKC